MTGVVHPVGPEEPVVYWRRRLVLALATLVTLIVLIRSFTGGEDPVPAAALTAPSAEAVAATPLPSGAIVSPTPAILQPTAQPTVPAVADGECSDADTSIKVEIDRETTAVGEGLHVNMVVKNISAVTCKRDVGSGANEITVISGPALIWSTDHCNPNTDKDLVELAPGQEWNVKVVWIGKQTATGCKVTNMADPGAYWAHGRNGSLNSAGAKFVVQ
ncbi:MAG: hypothetical protein ACO3GT_02485 [Candidatus Nanopelagicales bacterium]